MNELQITLNHPASGATVALEGQLLGDLLTGAKAFVSLAIQTAPLWVPLVVALAAPKPVAPAS